MNKKITGVLALFLLTGCLNETGEGPKNITPLRSPVDPTAGIRYVGPDNIIGTYNNRTPRDPGEWRKLNDEQTNPLEHSS